jgi:hypothetical protein
MGDLSVNVLLFRDKIMFKSHKIKSIHRVPRKNKIDAYVAQVLAPDYGTNVLRAEISINPLEHQSCFNPCLSILCLLYFYGQIREY